LQEKCGLPLSTYFSALKMRWLMDNVDAVKTAIAKGRCLFGTVDTWVVWVGQCSLTIIFKGDIHALTSQWVAFI